MLAKRLAIAILLAKDYDYRQIHHVLKVSFSTIMAVIKQQAINGVGYRRAVAKALRHEETEDFIAKLTKNVAQFLTPHPVGKRQIEAESRRDAYRRSLREI